ncbi:hypothetical protein E1202_16980 [Saccharopolyspora karakumensis]|uniref:PE family protein n=1 Tax=Saccharopolyspora karakumensis TaxID=2530386 RepID=A0A4R5BN25_9PSEU|nr:hypothetical protein [Saccharopolyspora karakumensis]TDD87269.1 hypothetical protein E1202_16980 [Saccharopolyspora karakumensis]
MNKPDEQASQSLAESTASVAAMRDAVESLDLKLDPAAGESIRSALDERLNSVDSWLSQARNLARQAPLGQNPVGTAMAEKFAGRAEGAEHSLVAVLTRYRDVLVDARDAIESAMRTYRETDQRVADSFQKLI